MKTAQAVSEAPASAAPGSSHLDVPDARETEESTRGRVARSILEHGPSTAAELADRLRLTPAAIRRHLDVLVERGHLTARDRRVYGARGRGRPAKVFVLTDTGRNGFYAAYDDLAVQVLQFLASEAGDAAVERFAANRVADMEGRYAHALATAPDTASPGEVLADELTADGYVASILPSASGEQLCQHHCPVAHVAERFPQLCEAETEVFARLVGGPVQRLATIAHGDGVCTTHIPSGIRPVPTPTPHPADTLHPPDTLHPSEGPQI